MPIVTRSTKYVPISGEGLSYVLVSYRSRVSHGIGVERWSLHNRYNTYGPLLPLVDGSTWSDADADGSSDADLHTLVVLAPATSSIQPSRCHECDFCNNCSYCTRGLRMRW